MSTPPAKPGRIAGMSWHADRPDALGIYNSAYSPSGRRLPAGPRPWTVLGTGIFRTFTTHAEAIAYAFGRVGT